MSPIGHTAARSSATAIGPWRYSIAGYASLQARAASRTLRAASLARPTVQPCPRKANRSNRAGSIGSGATSARSACRALSAHSMPTWPRSSTSADVANRVWTTDRSSANGMATTLPAARATGESGTAVIAVVGAASPIRASARTTSVVVPERESAITRSYRRPDGSSDAGKASVSPWPADSRDTAKDWAMYSEVPHPITSVR